MALNSSARWATTHFKLDIDDLEYGWTLKLIGWERQNVNMQHCMLWTKPMWLLQITKRPWLSTIMHVIHSAKISWPSSSQTPCGIGLYSYGMSIKKGHSHFQGSQMLKVHFNPSRHLDNLWIWVNTLTSVF